MSIEVSHQDQRKESFRISLKMATRAAALILLLVVTLLSSTLGSQSGSSTRGLGKNNKKHKVTVSPSSRPSAVPSFPPSIHPSTKPTAGPSSAPSSVPSNKPSDIPLPEPRDAPNPSFNDNFFLGTQALFGPNWTRYRAAPFSGRQYSEPGYDMLTEFRESVVSTGMNHFKFKLSTNACESYALSCSSSAITNLTQLAQVSEIADTLADSRLKWYHIWTYSWSLRNKLDEDFSEDQVAREYAEVFELTTHLLQTYQNTGKVFMLGNWEGDWELMWASGCRVNGAYDFSCVPSVEIVSKYVQWGQVRQAAISDARNAMNAQGVNVLYYMEFNLGKENFQDHPQVAGMARPTMVNSVVPFVNPDMLSYSSYKSTNSYMKHEGQWFNQTGTDQDFFRILDHAESKLGDVASTDLTPILGDLERRVFIGEYAPVRSFEADLFVPSAAQMIRASLEWGCPFVLHWEIFDNYSNTVPLIPTGADADLALFTPLRQFMKDWFTDAQAYVDANDPSSNELRLWAVEYFRDQYQPPALV